MRGVAIGLLALVGLVVIPGSASAGLSPSQITFPLTSPGDTSDPQTVTVANNSGSPMAVSYSLNNHAAAFLVDDDDCPAQLAFGATCGLLISFKPTARGNFYSELSVPGNGYVALVGNTPVPAGTITPGEDQDFGFAGPGDPKTKHFTVTSTGPIALPIDEVTTFGSGNGDFTVVPPDACVGDLAPNDTCEFDVKFNPQPGFNAQREALLAVMDPDGNTVALVDLAGTTAVADYTVSPTFNDFGEASIGTGLTRTPATFTITSTGDAPLPYAGSELFGGDHTDSYSVEDKCPTSVAVGQSCSVLVRFDPTGGEVGPRPAALKIKAGIHASAYETILMTGTATPPLPPTGNANLTLKLKAAKRIKRGKTLVVKATVKNTGNATATSVVLNAKSPKKLAKKAKSVKIPSLAPGESVTGKIKIKVKRTAKRGAKLKVKVAASAIGVSKKTAQRVVRIR